MAKMQLSIWLDSEDVNELHRQMLKKIVDSNGVIRYRMCESKVKQDWYRRVIRRGLDSYIREYAKKAKELEDGQI